MTPASPPADPGSRTLASWWKQFAPMSPRRMWFGHFPAQRLEVLVRTGRSVEASSFQRALLRAIDLHPATSVDQLDAALRLGLPVLGRLLAELHEAGLARPEGAGWQPTALGLQVLSEGTFARPTYERRSFAFLDPRPAVSPVFTALPTLPEWPGAIDADRPPLGVEVIREAIDRPDEWKIANEFPRDIDGVLGDEVTGSNGELLQPAWRRVVVVRPERLSVAAIEAGGKWLLFASRGDREGTISAEPVLTVDAESPLVPLFAEPSEEVWVEEWRHWCGSRNLPADETRGVQRDGHLLRVTVSSVLVEHLATHGGDQWLLAAGQPMRPAAQVTWQRG